MKTSAIIRIVICVVLLALLVGVFALGMYWYKTGTMPWKWPGGVSFGNNVNIGGYTYKNSDKYSVGAGEIDPAGITRLEINWIDGEVNIAVGQENKILLEEDTDLDQEDQLRYLVSGQTLIIQYCAPRTGVYTIDGNKHLTVTLPQSLAASLDAVEVDAVSARGDIQGLTAKECSIDNVSGNYTITGCDFGKLEVDSVSGNCAFTGTAGELNMDTVSGEMTANLLSAPREVDFDSVSGNMTLTVPEGTGFTVKLDSTSGDVDCDIPMTKSKDKYICGDGSVKIDMDTVSGDLIIRAN